MTAEKVETVRETLEKVVNSAPVEAERPAPGRQPQAPEPEPQQAGERLAPPTPDRPRDQFGRFARSISEGSTPQSTDIPQAETSPSEPSGPPLDQHEPTAEHGEPAEPAIVAPQSWSVVAKSEWDKLPRAVQEEVQRRESDVSRGFEQRAQQIRDFEPFLQAISPYAQKFTMRGQHPAQAVQQLLAVQDLLERDPVGGIAHVAQAYGVDLRQFAAASDAAQRSSPPQDPAVRQLSSQMAEMQAYIRNQAQYAQNVEVNRIQNEISAFEADKSHPHFAAVRPAMAQLMQSGLCTTLQEAYDHACWSIPEVRARIMSEQQKAEQAQRLKAERDAADRARRAGASVGGAPSGNGAAMPPRRSGSLRDDIVAAIEQASR